MNGLYAHVLVRGAMESAVKMMKFGKISGQMTENESVRKPTPESSRACTMEDLLHGCQGRECLEWRRDCGLKMRVVSCNGEQIKVYAVRNCGLLS
jgi:hypothetical protein